MSHRFHVDNNSGELYIGYYIIVGHKLILQLGLSVDFKHQVLQWDDDIVPMKEPIILMGQTDLTSHDMCDVVMHNEELVSTREDTERLVKIIDGT